MTTSAATTFATSFAAFAAQAALPWVPVEVQSGQVIYSCDHLADRTAPEPFLKLEGAPLTVEGMLGDEAAGCEFDVAGTSLARDWSKLQRTINGVSRFLEAHAHPDDFVHRGLRDEALWVSAAPDIFDGDEIEFEEIGGAQAALGAMIFGKKLPTYMAAGAMRLEQPVFKLLGKRSYDMAAMLLELGAHSGVPLQDSMERFGRLGGHAWFSSVENDSDAGSFELRLARGIWYGWLDTSGYIQENFYRESLRRSDLEISGREILAHSMGMVGARLRRRELTHGDWVWIAERMNFIRLLLECRLESDRSNVIGAHDLEVEALVNSEGT